jgi:membrane protein
VPGAAVIVRAAEKSNEDHAKDMAASIAFFGFFSLFPLLVGVVAGASFFIDRDKIESHLDRMLAGEFPGSADFLRTNIEALTDLRGAAGVASVVGLLWSASKMFGALSRGMNLALGIPKGQPFYVSKLRYFAMTIIVSLVLFLAVGGSMALDVFTQIDLMRFGLDSTVFDSIWSHLTSFVFIFATLLLLYTIVPYKRSPWRELLPGALVAALLFEVSKALFVLYLDYARNLEAIYGSLSSIVVLLLWLYFSARVLLFGVEIIAVRKEPSTHELV